MAHKSIILSVVIPCYNNGDLLSKMLDCIIRQTFKDWETIIVDDGSTDDTYSVAEKYSQKDSRIKAFKREREPKGSVICRNIGFEKATGEYVIHFDADDLISDTCFENRVAFMKNHPEIDYASFPAKLFTDENKLPKFSKRGYTLGVKRSGDLLTDFLTHDYSFSVWNNIYRKKAIENIKWDENVCIYTDFSYIVPCILVGLKHAFSGLQKIDYYYRVSYTPTNMCSSFVSDKKCESTCYLFSKTLDSLQGRNDYEKRKKEFFQYILVHMERLVVENNEEHVNSFLSMCNIYYKKEQLDALEKIFRECSLIDNVTKKRIHYYKKVFIKFRNHTFFTDYWHTLVKYRLGIIK